MHAITRATLAVAMRARRPAILAAPFSNSASRQKTVSAGRDHRLTFVHLHR